MRIVPSDPAQSALDRFIELPYRLYAGDPGWVPPFRDEVRRLLSPVNPFFRYGAAQTFLCLGPGDEPIGRAAAILNPHLTESGKLVGLVGFFECEDRADVAETLLHQATDWLRARGCARVWGPMNFSIYHSYRLMTSGFDRTPFYGEPRNKPYYPKLFEAAGFQPLARWSSWDVDEPAMRALLASSEERARDADLERKQGLRVEFLSLQNFDDELARFHQVVVRAFEGNLGFTPIGLDEFRELYGDMRLFVIPELVLFFVDAQGRTVGLGNAFPDIAPAVAAMRGKTGLLSKLRFLLGKRRVDRVNLHIAAFLPSVRGSGIMHWCLSKMLPVILAHRFRKAVVCLTKEGVTFLDRLGQKATRSYSLYARDL